MITLPQIKKEKAEPEKINSQIYSLGLVIPFHPSMTERKTIEGVLNFTLEMVELKLEGKVKRIEIDQITKRLQKIFDKLNYNSHRKSLSIILEGDVEKVMYLNYSGKPVFLFNDTFSILDLVGNSIKNPEFELLVFKKEGAELYEYFNNSLHKVFGQTQKLCNDYQTNNNCLIQRISNIIKRVNNKNDKPIFVFSEDEQQTDQFCETFPFKEIAFKLSTNSDENLESKIQMLVRKIIHQWDFQQTKLVKGQIAIARRTKSLYSTLPRVINSLKHSDDGLLLVDSYMKDEIHNMAEDEKLFAATQKLNDEIEKFLARGNRIEITKGGLLENFGGIALIKNNSSKFQYNFIKGKYKEEDFFS